MCPDMCLIKAWDAFLLKCVQVWNCDVYKRSPAEIFQKKKEERREKREEVAEIIDRIVVTRGEEQQMSN